MRRTLKQISLTALFCIAALAGYSQSGFTQNKGQWDSRINYALNIPSGRMYLEDNRFTYIFHDAEKWHHLINKAHVHAFDSLTPDEHIEDFNLNMHTVMVDFVGSNPINLNPVSPSSEYYNYFIGNNPEHWANKVRAYQEVNYQSLYNGIDLKVYLNDNQLKYDFIVQPGADINQIAMNYRGVDKIRLRYGKLHIQTSVNSFIEEKPYAYQIINGEKVEVKCDFTLFKTNVGFEIKGNYDKTKPLIIDPILIFSTYSGSTVDNFGYTATYDSEGNGYTGGTATYPQSLWEPLGRYPATAGAFMTSFNGGTGQDQGFANDIVLSKYNTDGTQLLYATYLGGFNDEYPQSLIVDKNDNLIVFGSSYSNDFPMGNNPAFNQHRGLTDMIITKLSADGTTLMGSTFLGGDDYDGQNTSAGLAYFTVDRFRGEVMIDDNDFIYIASCTRSENFPATPGAIQGDLDGDQDGCVAKFNADLSTLIWATYYGGRSSDAFYSLEVDNNGNVYVAGGTLSDDYPITAGSYMNTPLRGGGDGVITRLSANGDITLASTYITTNRFDQVFAIERDDFGFIYAVGLTTGSLPISPGRYNTPGSGQFLLKLDENLTSHEWITQFGAGKGRPDMTINAFLVDQCGKIYVSGWGGGISARAAINTSGLPTTNDAYQKTTDNADFYLIVFTREAEGLQYASYFGGRLGSGDHVDGGTSRFDHKGIVYQSVCSSCPNGQPDYATYVPISDFPTTPNAVYTTNVSPRCSNTLFKYDFEAQNKPPAPPDIFIEVVATDELNLNYVITDPNKEDTLYVDIIGDIFGGGKLDPPFATLDLTDGILGPVEGDIKWQTTCDHLTGDTIYLSVKARDIGCPTSDTSNAVIKLLVTEPPLTLPPDYFCLTFNNQGGISLSFDSITTNSYFKRFDVYKVPPGSSQPVLVHSQTEPGPFSFVDNNVNNPEVNNYCYYIVGVNICDRTVRSSYDICSVAESEFPVDTSYVVTATVENNEFVRVSWLSTTELDFGSYQVYKLAEGDGDPLNFRDYKFLGATYGRKDTFWIDKDVDVQNTSYCYRLVVTDKCGHRSKPTNRGCTIVLKGSTIFLQHDLNWNNYEDWKGEVVSYTLFEHVDTGNYVPIVVNPASELSHQDRVFDYDWGGYWYKVIAQEDSTNGGYGATSQSNEIYLIQPPLLHVPNAFTPNGDYLNDSFETVDVFVKEYNMKIFNRWGEKIFETDDKNEFWSGVYSDADPRNNAFVWMVTYRGWDNRWHYVHGTVNILR